MVSSVSMVLKSQRGELLTIILVVCGVAAATQIVPNWRVGNLWKKGPPSKELVAAEEAALRARTDANAARSALEKMQADAAAKQKDQVAYAQQMIAGVPAALKKEPQTPGVKLATGLAERATSGLAAAIGDLPSAKQAEILAIVDAALSNNQEKIDAAARALAAKDAELQVVTKARVALEAQLPAILKAKEAAEAKVEATAAVATAKAAEVARIADELFAEKRASGSLGAMVQKLGYATVILAVLALVGFIAWSWLKVTIGGLPKAFKSGLAVLRAKGVIPPEDQVNDFDPFLNRSEQDAIRKAT